jgi:PmbA protein
VNYEQLAKKLVQRAKKMGASQAEAYLEIGRTSSCRVHEGQIEDLTQATSKGVGLRVIFKDRLGFACTSDFDPDRLNEFVDRTLTLAQVSAPNKLNGLPQKKDLVLKDPAALGELFDPEVANLATDWKIKAALEMEKAAKAQDPRITAFSGVGAGDYVVDVYVASSEGLSDAYSGTYVYLYAGPVASENGQLQTSDWMDYKRFLGELESPESVGREAARRALRMLGAKKVKSKKVPVVFDPQMAASFVRGLAGAASGDAVFQGSSFLAKLLGKKIGSANLTLVDDGRLKRGLSSAPFDGEGVPTRKTAIVEKGVVKNFLYDSFTARKAKAKVTGNAARSYDGLPHIGVSNLYIEPGTVAPEELIREVQDGFYVTSMLGHGLDMVTGEYSRGANGLWIENGELAYPVQEVTVAGNMLDMVKNVDGIGSDLQFRGSTGAPTVRFSELMVAGE